MTDALSDALAAAALCSGFTFLCTAAGSAAVLFMRPGRESPMAETLSLGFAAGIMIAASVWSLIMPALEGAECGPLPPWLVVSGGILAGALMLKVLDAVMPHLHPGAASPEGPRTKLQRAWLLFFAITLHNLPEGGSVGLTAGLGALDGSAAVLSPAFALALGIGIQNIPEGAAVSLPLAAEGMSRMRAFLFGTLSGLVEPVCALLVVPVIGLVGPAMPFLLALAAGAMLYVVVEELIPAAHLESHSDAGTLAVIAGFVIMMALDTALG